MSPGPDFYCDFYCGVWDGLREPGTTRHRPGSRPSPSGVSGAPRGHRAGGVWRVVPRSSGSRVVQSGAQRLVLVGRPRIDGLRVCQTSPIGSIRRGL